MPSPKASRCPPNGSTPPVGLVCCSSRPPRAGPSLPAGGLMTVPSTVTKPWRGTVGSCFTAVSEVDVRGAIGFSSFGVLAYYALANASAWTLSPAPVSRVVPVLGLLGCVTLALALPEVSVAVGAAVLGVGAVAFGVRRCWGGRREPSSKP